MLAQKIQQATIAALKNHADDAVSILRFITAAVKNRQIAVKRSLTDEEVLAIIQKEAKNLGDVVVTAGKAGRHDLVKHNQKQLEVLSFYLA